MLLSDLVENLVTHMNDGVDSWSEDGTVLTSELDLFPSSISTTVGAIIPSYSLPVIERQKQRGQRIFNSEILYVSLIFAKEFQEVTTGPSIANWSEVKPLMDTWQRAQQYLMKFSSREVTLVAVEPKEPEPLEQDLRNYAVMTLFGFEVNSCASAHELVSPDSNFRSGTVLQGIRDSIKSRR